MQMRWHWPPENWWGRRSAATAGSMPTASSTCVDLRLAARPWCPRPRSRAARRRCRRPCAAGSATRSGPGRSSACSVRSWRRSSPCERGELVAVEADAAARRAGELHDRPAGGRLAAARLADEAEGLARQDVEADAGHGVAPCRPVRPTGNSTTRSSTRSSASPSARRWAVPLPAISSLHARRGERRPRPAARRRPRGTRASRRGTSSGTRGRASRPRSAAAPPRGTSSCAYGQRGAKRQPVGGLTRSGGRPAMTSSRVWLGLLELRDRLCSSASVYGIFMLANSDRGRRLLDDLAGVHHGDLVGAAGHDAEVVGDEDHRHVALALLLLRAGRGSGPAR